jgi:hypothetical protein
VRCDCAAGEPGDWHSQSGRQHCAAVATVVCHEDSAWTRFRIEPRLSLAPGGRKVQQGETMISSHQKALGEGDARWSTT